MPPKNNKNTKTTSSSTPTIKEQGAVFEFAFPNMEIMSRSMSRFSAFVEDPDYESIPLSQDQMNELNLPSKRYAGHNMPLPLFDLACQHLSQFNQFEQIVIRAINEYTKIIKPRKLAYIIGYIEGDAPTFNHEKQHAIYYFSPDYQARVQGVFNSVQSSFPKWHQQFIEHLSKMYCSRVHIDEFQAILLNREYECVQKIQQLLKSIAIDKSEIEFVLTKVSLPKNLIELYQQEVEKEKLEKEKLEEDAKEEKE